ncbi:hypothetical protein TIFTF001_035640 [Ficus carica]|uniref:Uncharacterized protein n=1 Tax=Ficus carica TaxID=3494 RepID=A0AA88J6Q2_FICCA|nr:hypothetical protein TIFTF001_035640 [Ficus carica]
MPIVATRHRRDPVAVVVAVIGEEADRQAKNVIYATTISDECAEDERVSFPGIDTNATATSATTTSDKHDEEFVHVPKEVKLGC